MENPCRAPAQYLGLIGGVKMGWCGASIYRTKLRQGWVVLGAGVTGGNPCFPRKWQIRVPLPSPLLSSQFLSSSPISSSLSSLLLCSALLSIALDTLTRNAVHGTPVSNLAISTRRKIVVERPV